MIRLVKAGKCIIMISSEMPELLPDETPAIEPTPEPLIIPMDPDIEPDIRMPEEMKTAA